MHFAVPSALKLRLELSMLLNAWEMDTTCFQKLSRAQWEHFQVQRAGTMDTNVVGVIHAVTLASSAMPALVTNPGDAGASK